MTADDYLNEDIREEFAKHHSVFRVAKALHITLDRVRAVVGENEYTPEKKNVTTYDGMGRPELEKYVVARKDAFDEWDNDNPSIQEARRRHEAGTHIMCSGRDGDWIIL